MTAAPTAFILGDPEYLELLYLLLGGAVLCVAGYLGFAAMTAKPPQIRPPALIAGVLLGAVVIWAVLGLLLDAFFDWFTESVGD